jgi:hypothetical protein
MQYYSPSWLEGLEELRMRYSYCRWRGSRSVGVVLSKHWRPLSAVREVRAPSGLCGAELVAVNAGLECYVSPSIGTHTEEREMRMRLTASATATISDRPMLKQRLGLWCLYEVLYLLRASLRGWK